MRLSFGRMDPILQYAHVNILNLYYNHAILYNLVILPFFEMRFADIWRKSVTRIVNGNESFFSDYLVV